MPAINTDGLAKTRDYNLGRGIVYLAELNTDGTPKGYRDLGNAPAFNITVNVEELLHKSSRTGTSVTDKRIVISQEIAISLTLEELNAQNVALFFSGEQSTYVNPAVAGFAEHTIGKSVKDFWYDVKTALGVRAVDIETANLTVKSGAAVLVLNTDYTVDTVMGRFFLLSAGAAVDANDLKITLAADAGARPTVDQVRGLKVSQQSYALKFIAENPANAGEKSEYEFHSVLLNAEGDFSLIGDELTQLPLSGTAQANDGTLFAGAVLSINTPTPV